MRIAFVTGSLEPGRDGVGDYVRTLADECARHGHEVALVALAEPGPVEKAGDERWPILRLAAAQARVDGGREVRRWLDAFAPDWTSLHFVPYSFHPRGFFAPKIPRLKAVLGAGARRHIFFHEIWIGSAVDAPWRQRVSGWWQQRAVRALLRGVAPAGVHTSIGYYRVALAKKLRQPATVLPIFGSIPWRASAQPLADAALGVPKGALVCGMFGALHPNWQAEPFLADFAALAAEQRRPAVFAAAGTLRYGAELFRKIAERWRERVTCLEVGVHSPERLAEIFARFDFAVTSVPWNMLGKSSSAAALREHGLPVVVTNEGTVPRFGLSAADVEPGDAGFIDYFRARSRLRTGLLRTGPRAGVAASAQRFLADLESWGVAAGATKAGAECGGRELRRR